MLQLRRKNDQLRHLLSCVELGGHPPDYAATTLAPDARLRALAVPIMQEETQSLMMERETGSWCFLDPTERSLYERLEGQRLAELVALNPSFGEAAIRMFVVEAYLAGLVEVDGRRFVDPSLFAAGPVAAESPLLLIVPTERCNLACSYCFASQHWAGPGRLDQSKAERAIDLFADLVDSGTIEFAGGEALLEADLVLDLVKYATASFEQRGKRVRCAIQTNATLMTEEILDRIKQLGIVVGVSLDGPQQLDDRTRTLANGGSSYPQVVRAIEQMQHLEIPFGVIAVISRGNYDRVPDILDHFQELGLQTFKMNAVYRIGRAERGWADVGLEPAEFLQAHRAYLDAVEDGSASLYEDNTRHMIDNLATRMHPYRCMRSQCGAGKDFITVNPAGDLFACSRYRGLAATRLGNITEIDSLRDLWRRNPYLVALDRRTVETIPECTRCDLKRFCEAGCALDTGWQPGEPFAPHPLCEYTRTAYREILARTATSPEFAERLSPDVEVLQRSFFGPEAARLELHP
ncbi:MAG: radical SAM protein [Anaerolineae bacterium]